jgi:hypothetical protein
MSDSAPEHVLDYEAAMSAPERDITVTRHAWEHAVAQLRGVRPTMLRLAREYRASLYVNSGGRYPEPALILERGQDDVRRKVQLSPEPFAAEATMLAGYRLGILGPVREPIIRWLPWFSRTRSVWTPLALLDPEAVRAGAPSVISASENAAQQAFRDQPAMRQAAI